MGQGLLENAGEGFQEKGLFGHEAGPHSVFLQSLGNDGAYRGNQGFAERCRDRLRGRYGEKTLDLWSAGECDGIHLAGLDAPKERQHRRIFRGVGVNVWRDGGDFCTRGLEEFNERTVRLRTVELHTESPAFEVVRPQTGDDTIRRGTLGCYVRFQAELS